MLNSEFVRAQAKGVAGKVLNDSSSTEDRVNEAFRLILCRLASSAEQQEAAGFLTKIEGDSSGEELDQWTNFCLALFNTAEFRYLN